MNEEQRMVSPSDIAELAGRSRAAVSNWRANPRLEFPAPVAGTQTRPLFDFGEVKTWLQDRQGIDVREDPGVEIWSILNTRRGQYDTAVALSRVVQMFAKKQVLETPDWRAPFAEQLERLAHLGPQGLESVRRWDATVHALEKGQPLAEYQASAEDREFAASLERAVDRLEVAELRPAAEYLLDRHHRSLGRVAGEVGSPGSAVSAILGAAASTVSRATVVYDPNLGVGEAILEASRDFPDAVFLGDFRFENQTDVAFVRGFLAGIVLDVAEVDALVGDVRSRQLADVVLLETDLEGSLPDSVSADDERWLHGTPHRTFSEMLWLQHALAHLDERGVAFVVTTMRSLYAKPVERIRRSLLEAGNVERIVALPPKLHAHTSIPLALWVLRTNNPEQTVTFVDASDSVEFDHLRTGEGVVPLLVATAGEHVSQASVADIVEAGSNLVPSRWANVYNTMFDSIDELVQQNDERLTDLVARVRRADNVVLDAGDAPDLVRLRDLSELVEVIRPRGREKTAPVKAEVDDVILHTAEPLRTYGPSVEGLLVERDLVLLRVKDTEVLDPGFLAAVLPGPWNDRHFTGTIVRKVLPQDLEIPVIPIGQQRAWAAEITRQQGLLAQAKKLTFFLEDEVIPALRTAAVAGYVPTQGNELVDGERSQTGPKDMDEKEVTNE